MELKKKHFCR